MIQIEIKKDPNKFRNDREYIRFLIRVLREIVEEALREWVPKKIGIGISDFGPLDIYENDVQITITAKKHPAREKDLLGRVKFIQEKIRANVPGLIGHFSVQINLANCEYIEG